jgi:hypothetical protein
VPFLGSEQFGGDRIASAQAAQDRRIAVAAGGLNTFDVLQVNQLPHLTLAVRQTTGDALFTVALEVKVAREWRTIDTFTMTGFPGPTILREYRIAAHEARVTVDYQAGGAVASAGWFVLSAFGL